MPSIRALSAFSFLALLIVPRFAGAAFPNPILWNKLGSTSEITASAYGPNLGFYNDDYPFDVDVAATPAYVPGEFGNAASISGSYNTPYRMHNIVWSNVNQYLNPERGTIEAWYKQNSDPVAFDHGVYRIFDGSYGLGSGIGLTSEVPSGPAQLYFGMDFGGTPVGVSSNISAFNGSWIHVAGVWDRNGIASTADKVRLYVNGNKVAANTSGAWGTSVGLLADIAGGNDANIAGQFAVDNLKVWDGPITDFSQRFNESFIPEPALLPLGAVVLLGFSRRKRPNRRTAWRSSGSSRST